MTSTHDYRIAVANVRGPKCSCTTCHYCENQVSPSHEHDHFPIPKSAGGTEVVAACTNGHDMKDRVGMHMFDATLTTAALLDLMRFSMRIPNVDVYIQQFIDELDHDLVLRAWHTMTPMSRVLYARLRRVREQVPA